MQKIDIENISLGIVAEKVNEIVDILNDIQRERIEKLKKELNFVRYGKYMTDEEVIADMKRQDELTRIIGIMNGWTQNESSP